MVHTRRLVLLATLSLLTIAATQCSAPPPVEKELPLPTAIPPAGERSIQPIPLQHDIDPRVVALGRRLFLDGRLSADNEIACDSCHKLDLGGADRLDRSIGIRGQLGHANAPTVLNSGFNASQFWNGRAATLEEQIDGPVHSPFEMDSNWPDILAKLRADDELVAAFAELYRDGLTPDTVKSAIADFERSLITPNSPFDRWLRGETSALTPEEIEGYRLFQRYGCETCHFGPNAGGAVLARFGAAHDYFARRAHISKIDLGRYTHTGDAADRHVFKTPGLRNIALTAPYFHDASAASLEQAVAIMAYTQAGIALPWSEAQSIAAFLRTLTGELDGAQLTDIVPLPPQTDFAALASAEQGAELFGAYCAMCHSAPAHSALTHSALTPGLYTWGAIPLDTMSGEMPGEMPDSHAEFAAADTQSLRAFLR